MRASCRGLLKSRASSQNFTLTATQRSCAMRYPAAKLVHLTVEGEEQVRVLALRHDRAAEALDRLVSECRRWTRLVVSVDAQQRYGHRAYVSLELFVAVVDAVIYARVAEDDQHVLARCAPVAAEARDALKAPVCVAGEVDVHISLLI